MKSLLNAAYNKEMIGRVNHLTPSAKARWGSMTVDQMLAHLNLAFNSALGEVKEKREILGYLFGRIAKRKILSSEPVPRNLPTAKAFRVKGEYNFDDEKDHLIALLEHYLATKGKDINKYPHSFFGHMTTMEWDQLVTKHLDHHLTQFGV